LGLLTGYSDRQPTPIFSSQSNPRIMNFNTIAENVTIQKKSEISSNRHSVKSRNPALSVCSGCRIKSGMTNRTVCETIKTPSPESLLQPVRQFQRPATALNPEPLKGYETLI
jgi:hypothetical protein